MLKGDCPIAARSLWVSDITYIRLQEGFCYLSLVTDAYSRKIVGWCLGDSLQACHTEKALRMAIDDSLEKGHSLAGLIHHSDRGIQYACSEYTKLLKEHDCLISMTENGDPLENAMAERVNGILKQEWLHNYTFDTIEEVYPRIQKIIKLYNTQRPHSSIGMKTPEMMHEGVPYVPEDYLLEQTTCSQDKKKRSSGRVLPPLAAGRSPSNEFIFKVP